MHRIVLCWFFFLLFRIFLPIQLFFCSLFGSFSVGFLLLRSWQKEEKILSAFILWFLYFLVSRYSFSISTFRRIPFRRSNWERREPYIHARKRKNFSFILELVICIILSYHFAHKKVLENLNKLQEIKKTTTTCSVLNSTTGRGYVYNHERIEEEWKVDAIEKNTWKNAVLKNCECETNQQCQNGLCSLKTNREIVCRFCLAGFHFLSCCSNAIHLPIHIQPKRSHLSTKLSEWRFTF